MAIDIEYDEGQTPLDEDEKAGLKISSITTRKELDEFEQLNIQKAIQWTLGKKWKLEKICSEAFVMELHWRMYHDVWNWAGKFRKSDKNIGVKHYLVATDLKNLLDDVCFWVKVKTYSADEVAIRFKHRIVSIHCFANGNGRHSRLLADIVISHVFGGEVYDWGRSTLVKADELRKSYITALKHADKGEIEPLIFFAKGK